MKKRISMIMVICLLLSLTACGVNSSIENWIADNGISE